jgi:DNA-directed RNA polymerase subunit M/transcription elongation factor TFIIS
MKKLELLLSNYSEVERLYVIRELILSDRRVNLKMAMEFEESIFNKTKDIADNREIEMYWENERFLDVYNSQFIKVVNHINGVVKCGLIKRVMKGELEPVMICYYDISYISPESWKKERNKHRISLQQKINWKTTELYDCSVCKNSKCYYFARQTRSPDEPITVFITCKECGHHWTQNN